MGLMPRQQLQRQSEWPDLLHQSREPYTTLWVWEKGFVLPHPAALTAAKDTDPQTTSQESRSRPTVQNFDRSELQK